MSRSVGRPPSLPGAWGEAATAAGGVQALARALRCCPETLWRWAHGGCPPLVQPRVVEVFQLNDWAVPTFLSTSIAGTPADPEIRPSPSGAVRTGLPGAWKEAAKAAGGVQRLARVLLCTPSTVHKWARGHLPPGREEWIRSRFALHGWPPPTFREPA